MLWDELDHNDEDKNIALIPDSLDTIHGADEVSKTCINK